MLIKNLFIAAFMLLISLSCNVASIITGAETNLGNHFGKDLTPGLLLFWNFDEGKGVDKVDRARSMVLADTSTTGFDVNDGRFGNGIDCASNSSGSGYFENNSPPIQFDASTTDYNISFWIKTDVAVGATTSTILEYPGLNISFTMLDSPNRLDMQATMGGASINPNGIIDANDFNNWAHISMNFFAGGSIDIYKNGNYYGNFPTGNSNVTAGFFILCSGTSGSNGFHGSMDSFGVWERILEEDEIRALSKGNTNLD